jgi:transposase
MLPVTGSTRVFLHRGVTDMRRSFDGLSALITTCLREDPLSGALFVFCNRRKDRLKILYWDGDGFALWYKRLERGTFVLPGVPETQSRISSAQLAMLLEGIIPLRLSQRYQRA